MPVSRARPTANGSQLEVHVYGELLDYLDGLVAVVNQHADTLDVAGLVGPPHIDLRMSPFNVVANDNTKGAANVAGINLAITTYSGTLAALVMPRGLIYIDKAGANWSILFSQTTTLVSLVGQGQRDTTLVQEGIGTAQDWYGIKVAGQGICLSKFGIMQGVIDRPSAGQHDHLIALACTGGVDTVDTTLTDLYFGKCLGDAIAFIGDTNVVRGTAIDNCRFRLAGFVTKTWSPQTTYAVGAQVRNGLNGYVCTTGGVSASGSGPTEVHVAPNGTTGIVDGECRWSTMTFRFAARTGISFQRGYSNFRVTNVDIAGAQNSGIDMESTGSGTLEYAVFDRVRIDNTLGNTAVAMTFSGVGNGDRTQFPRMTNVTIIEGGVLVASTDNAVIENLTVIMNGVRPNDPTQPLLQVRQVNNNLRIVNPQLFRGAGATAGLLIDCDNTGDRTTIDGGYYHQATDAGVIDIARTSYLRIINRPQIKFDGATPAARRAINVLAQVGSCLSPQIEGVHLISTTGKMHSCISLQSRTGRTMDNVRVQDIHSAGSATTGVYFSFTAGTMDLTPQITGINNGTDVAWAQKDASDAAVTTMFPIIAGNRGDVCIHVGDATPEGAVTAKQGSQCVLRNGDSTAVYRKTSGVAATGWVTP